MSDRVGFGADGCRGGWCVVRARRRTGPERFAFEAAWLVGELADAFAAAPRAAEFAVDMPIGLVDGTDTRACDDLARRALGPRRASVFAAPPRAVLDAADHAEANARAKRASGRGLSVQAWNLVPRIREVDAWLRRDADAGARVFECHPELAFARFAGAPMVHAKRAVEGRSERLALLESWAPGSTPFVEAFLARTRRAEVAADDALDACALAVVAALPPSRRESLPADPPLDGVGLPMRIVTGTVPDPPVVIRRAQRGG